jgi:hypothetical protein
MIPRLKSSGQSTTETIILLPLYFVFVFGLLQVAQLGIALAVSSYAASSVARRMVQDNTLNASSYQATFQNLMTAGMRYNDLYADNAASGAQIFTDITVHACAEVSAFPLVGDFLNRPLTPYKGNCRSGNAMGPFSFSGPPYKFIVRGRAVARMNVHS